MIITLTGASGSGKTTVAKAILSRVPSAKLLTSYTTRAPRSSDLPGEYEYLDDAMFDGMRKAGRFLWTAEITGVRHGTTEQSVSDALRYKTATRIMILVPEVLAKLYVFANRMGGRNAITSFFIQVPDRETLRKRMAARGDKPESVEARISACRDYERAALVSGIGYIWVDNTGELDTAVNKIVKRLGQ